MTGKEKVIAEGKSFEEGRRGAIINTSGYWSEMCQGDEASPDDDEKGGGLEDKGNDFWIFDAESGNEKPQ